MERYFLNTRNIKIVVEHLGDEEKADISRRLAFYCPGSALIMASPVRAYFSRSPVLIFGVPYALGPFADKVRYGIFDVDYRKNPLDGWNWSGLSGLCMNGKPDIVHSHQIFCERIEEIQKENLSKCYIFGTGPTLGKAKDHDWSDGYRVVCNTIVKNQKLWNHIDPHFIAAGDAIYHFGHTDHAKQFRRDLAERLSESETFFMYPDLYDPIVHRELESYSDKLIPIPFNFQKKRIHEDLRKDFFLSGMGNVLPLLLLPLGCTLSKNIFLWGFDGRAPDDKLFWSNSPAECYPELIGTLKEAHPAFFDHFVPREDPFKYVRSVHGDILDECMVAAEREGFHFVMMHPSWTPTLKKRELAARVILENSSLN